RVTVRIADSETEVATFNNNTWSEGGSLELAGGRRFRANSNFWSTSYAFKDENDEMLVRFVRVRGLLRLSSNVEVTPVGAKLAELSLLVVLGWYLAISMHEDASAAAAAAGGGAG